jgi:PD-(D/E)XK nuclease superfamily
MKSCWPHLISGPIGQVDHRRCLGCLNALGTGSIEKLYQNALAHELRTARLTFLRQRGVTVMYDGSSSVTTLGEHCRHLCGGPAGRTYDDRGAMIVRLKAVEAMVEIHRAQCINYPRATGLQTCLLLNFGNPRLETKLVVLSL